MYPINNLKANFVKIQRLENFNFCSNNLFLTRTFFTLIFDPEMT